ncbi:MAG: tRNA pseudouridine(55) synthase TruB [Proteobacteria bacterium]|nr:tRNA pseudouridine(55) synthase TruB [Pseudomonadota bacterium]
MTSFQVIRHVRRCLTINKIGHGGTLDPLASGVLPLALGEATKVIPFIINTDKVYDFQITFGQLRSTDDAEGEVLNTTTVFPTLEQIQKALASFKGIIDQTPPIFSAIKIKGKRSYDLARKGQTPILKSRKIHIHDLEIISQESSHQVNFRLSCSKGTYVRSLARDLAYHLGSLGYVSKLRRLQVGKFSLKDAISLEKIQNFEHSEEACQWIKPISVVLDDIPAITVSEDIAQKLYQGQKMKFHDLPSGVFSVVFDNKLIAIAEEEEGFLRPKRVFKEKTIYR